MLYTVEEFKLDGCTNKQLTVSGVIYDDDGAARCCSAGCCKQCVLPFVLGDLLKMQRLVSPLRATSSDCLSADVLILQVFSISFLDFVLQLPGTS